MSLRELSRTAGRVLATAAAAAVCGIGVGVGWQQVAGDRMALWLVARAAGASGFVLLTAVTLTGIVLSHPSRARFRWPNAVTRLRLHVSLTVFALVFTVMHVVVLVLDPYAKVGWTGALLPMGAAYRPVPVTLGVIALWAGFAAGLTAALAGRLNIRWWRGLHRMAALAWAAAWAHSVLAGSDSGVWTVGYVVAGLAVVGAGWWRYSAAKPASPTKSEPVGSHTEAGSAAPSTMVPPSPVGSRR